MTRLDAPVRVPTRSWSTSALLWVIAITTMTVFQFWRGAPIDGLIFAGIAVTIVVERLIRIRRAESPAPPTPSTTPGGGRRLAIILAVALAATIVIIVAPRTGPVSITLIAALGLAAVALVWNRAPGSQTGSPQLRLRSRIVWASVGIALCVWEALAYILSVAVPRGWIGFPTLSLLLEPTVNFDPTRAVLTVAWLAAGVWLVAGVTSRRSAARAEALS